jgi:hypothetical protein
MSRGLKVFWAAYLILVLSLAGAVQYRKNTMPKRVVAMVKAASFELNTKVVLAFYAKDGWEKHWPKFAKDTGAVLGRPDGVGSDSASIILFYVSGGGTAWFFGQNENFTFAMTNFHVVDENSVVAAINGHPLMKEMSASGTIDRASLWLCPNFSDLDEFPSCMIDADPVFSDRVLDAAVIRLDFGTKIKRVTTLPLGAYEDVAPGTPTITVGAGVGVGDLEGFGKTVKARSPYFPDASGPDLGWRWTVPYDMDTVGGFSGSPVVDLKTGLVIGLHKGALSDPRGSGRAVALLVPMEFIARVLITNDFPVTTDLRLEE